MRDGARLALAVAVIAFALRLPFLAAGYGWDSDAWRVAAAAAAMAETGVYAAPRLPGNPVHDITAALLWASGPAGRSPLAQNGATALVSALGAGAFALAWRRRGLPHALLAGVAIASLPALFVASVSTLDYAWGFAFVAGALAAATHGRALLAGAFAALAIGTRLPAAACLPGLALFLVEAMRGEPRRGPRLLGFVAVALAGGALPYVPLWLERGAGALAFYDHGYPPAWLVAKKFTVDLWGWIGSAALALAGALALLVPALRAAGPFDRATAGRAALGFLAPLAAWLRLPYKAAYLAPATPFLVLGVGAALPARLLRPLLVVLVVTRPGSARSTRRARTTIPAPRRSRAPSPWAAAPSCSTRAGRSCSTTRGARPGSPTWPASSARSRRCRPAARSSCRTGCPTCGSRSIACRAPSRGTACCARTCSTRRRSLRCAPRGAPCGRCRASPRRIAPSTAWTWRRPARGRSCRDAVTP